MLQVPPNAIVAMEALPRSASAPLLRLEDISLSFGGVIALADVDLSIDQRTIHAIIGPNGAGKSSLINIISGIYKPDKGYIRFAGENFLRVPIQRLAHLHIARTFQNIALFKGLTVLDNVIMGLTTRIQSNFGEQIFCFSRARTDERTAYRAASEMIEFLELGRLRDRLVCTLPYGLQKRVELARALIAAPRLLLLDEPMAGMTVQEKVEMSHFVRNVRDRFGTTVVLIEHDVGVVMGLSDRVSVLNHGRKIAEGAPHEIRSDQRVIDAYLGVDHDDTADEFV